MIRTILLAAPAQLNTNSSDPIGPLTEVGGRSLLKRNLVALENSGIHDVVIVTGDDGDEIRRHLEGDPEITSRIIWLEEAGSQVQALSRARQHVNGPTLAMAANLLFAPEMLGHVVDQPTPHATLLVDRKLARVFDIEHALKVQCQQGQVRELGAGLTTYDAIAVGMTVVTPQLLDSLGSGEGQLAEALRPIAHSGALMSWDVNGSHWQQVDSPESRRHAEWLLRAYSDDLASHRAPSPSGGSDPQRTLDYIEGLLNDSGARHYELMNPCPVLTSPRVKSALVHHDVCHRDDDYSAVVRRVQRKLRRVCRAGPEHDILLLSGSGTAAMEAALSSCVPEDGKLLVISNGAFGERFAEIAAVHRLETVRLRYEWGELVDPADVERHLRSDGAIVGAVMCHHETSIGILNPVRQVGEICRRLDRLFFVDAVSSLGGEEIDVRRDKIDIMISSANKCMHAISGVSFACVNSAIWPRIEKIPPRVYYLDLKRYRDQGSIPFTPAVLNFFALDAALDELLRQGVERRVQRYKMLSQWLRAELRRIGLQMMTQTGHESHSITTVRVPDDVAFEELYGALKERGFIVYGCKAALKDRYFQIANMGELSDEMVRRFVDTLEIVLQQLRQQTKVVPFRAAG